MEITIPFEINNDNYEEALAKGWFAEAIDVSLMHMHIKELPAPAMPNVKDVFLYDLPHIKELPALPNVQRVIVSSLPCLEELPDMPKATYAYLSALPIVKKLPAMPNAKNVHIDNLSFITNIIKQDEPLTWVTCNKETIKILRRILQHTSITEHKINQKYTQYTIKFKDEADEAAGLLQASAVN